MKPNPVLIMLYVATVVAIWAWAFITWRAGVALLAVALTAAPIILTWAHDYIHTGHIHGELTIPDAEWDDWADLNIPDHPID